MSEAEKDSTDTDQPKSYSTILDQEIELALGELERPTGGLLMSGLSAGLDIGFSALAVSIMLTLTAGEAPKHVRELLVAGAYTVGFIFVIFGRSELYTEHTTLAMLPVMRRRAGLLQLLRLWGLVYVANIVGTVPFAALLAVLGPALGVVSKGSLMELAEITTGHTVWVTFFSAVVAGWMMGLLSWLVTAARSTISEIFFVALITGLIGLSHLHHCVVGSVEVLAGLFAGSPLSVAHYARFMVVATLGNTVGGVVFVALIKYGHATRTRGRVHVPR